MKTVMMTVALMMTASMALAAPGRNGNAEAGKGIKSGESQKAREEREAKERLAVDQKQASRTNADLAKALGSTEAEVKLMRTGEVSLKDGAKAKDEIVKGETIVENTVRGLNEMSSEKAGLLAEIGGPKVIGRFLSAVLSGKENSADAQAVAKLADMLGDILSGKSEITVEQARTHLAVVAKAVALSEGNGLSIARNFQSAILEAKYDNDQTKVAQAEKDKTEYRECAR